MLARVVDGQEVALLHVTPGHRPAAVDGRVDLALDEARPFGVLVAVDQPHQLRLHLVGALAAMKSATAYCTGVTATKQTN